MTTMKHFITIFILVFSINFTKSQDKITFPIINPEGLSINEFIPTEWTILDSTNGDFNSDKFKDFIIIIEQKEVSENNSGKKRILFILFGSNDKLVLSSQSNNLVYDSDMGGVFGDPYSSINSSGNSFSITHFGGSRYKWSITYFFEYINNSWILIRENGSEGDSSENHTYSFDLKTKYYNYESNKEIFNNNGDSIIFSEKRILEKLIDFKDIITLENFHTIDLNIEELKK